MMIYFVSLLIMPAMSEKCFWELLIDYGHGGKYLDTSIRMFEKVVLMTTDESITERYTEATRILLFEFLSPTASQFYEKIPTDLGLTLLRLRLGGVITGSLELAESGDDVDIRNGMISRLLRPELGSNLFSLGGNHRSIDVYDSFMLGVRHAGCSLLGSVLEGKRDTTWAKNPIEVVDGFRRKFARASVTGYEPADTILITKWLLGMMDIKELARGHGDFLDVACKYCGLTQQFERPI